jgi:hypothetical protein
VSAAEAPRRRPSAAQSVAGADWTALPAAIRAIHDGAEAVGEGEVVGGETAWLRGLGRLLGFPRPAEQVAISLRVEQGAGGELWRRRFGAQRLDTRVEARGGLFAERFRGIELRFALRATALGLVFEQRRAALVCGPLRLPLPAALAPRIAAHDEPEPSRGGVRFSVVLFLWGRRLVGYAGLVTPGDLP